MTAPDPERPWWYDKRPVEVRLTKGKRKVYALGDIVGEVIKHTLYKYTNITKASLRRGIAFSIASLDEAEAWGATDVLIMDNQGTGQTWHSTIRIVREFGGFLDIKGNDPQLFLAFRFWNKTYDEALAVRQADMTAKQEAAPPSPQERLF